MASVQAEIQNKHPPNMRPSPHWLILRCFQATVLESFNYRIIMHPEDLLGQQAGYKTQFQVYRTHSNILLCTVQACSYQLQSLFTFFFTEKYKIARAIYKRAVT
jgi:hypothetical protein